LGISAQSLWKLGLLLFVIFHTLLKHDKKSVVVARVHDLFPGLSSITSTYGHEHGIPQGLPGDNKRLSSMSWWQE
jgi:hypothetical protein